MFFMDKNQSVITLIIIVLVVVCTFLYFVFRPQVSNEMVNMEKSDSSYSFDMDVAGPGDDAGEIIAEIEGIKKDNVKGDIHPSGGSDIKNERVVNSSIQNSPDTGPGEIALIIAAIFGVIGAFGAHKKMSKKS